MFMKLVHYAAIMCLLYATGCVCYCPTTNNVISKASLSEFDSLGYDCADTIAVARVAGVDYHKTVSGCLRRDGRSMQILFRLTTYAGFDGASAQCNATVLASLLRLLGDDFFGCTLLMESRTTQDEVQEALLYGFGCGNGVEESWIVDWYPITFSRKSGKSNVAVDGP